MSVDNPKLPADEHQYLLEIELEGYGLHVWAYRFKGEQSSDPADDSGFRSFGFENREMIGRCSQTLAPTNEDGTVDFYVLPSLKGLAVILRDRYFPKRQVILDRRGLDSAEVLLNLARRVEATLLDALERYSAQGEPVEAELGGDLTLNGYGVQLILAHGEVTCVPIRYEELAVVLDSFGTPQAIHHRNYRLLPPMVFEAPELEPGQPDASYLWAGSLEELERCMFENFFTRHLEELRQLDEGRFMVEGLGYSRAIIEYFREAELAAEAA